MPAFPHGTQAFVVSVITLQCLPCGTQLLSLTSRRLVCDGYFSTATSRPLLLDDDFFEKESVEERADTEGALTGRCDHVGN